MSRFIFHSLGRIKLKPDEEEQQGDAKLCKAELFPAHR